MPEQRVKYAIDKFWIQLQRKDKWIMIFPLMVYQRESYSDIEKRNTDYKSLMLDANKTEWLNAQKRIHDVNEVNEVNEVNRKDKDINE